MQKLDPAFVRERLTPWLSARMPHARDLQVTSISTPKGGGNSAETAFFDIAYVMAGESKSDSLVLRRQLDGAELFMGTDLQLPWRMMETMRIKGIPVPRMIGLEMDRAVLGNPFLVMEKVPGRMVPQSPNYNVEGWLKDATPAIRAAVWRNAIQTMVKIHQLDWRDGFEFLNRPELGEPGAEQQVKFTERSYRWAAAGRAQPVADAALDYLKRNAPAQLPATVLWGDATAGNILIAPDQSIAAVIDWEVAELGPAEADLAWWLMFDDLFSTALGIPKLPGIPDRAGIIAIYEAAAGRTVQHLDYFELLAYMRLAIAFTRMCDREIAQGSLSPNSRAYLENPITLLIARKLGLPEPEVGEEYFTALAATARHREE
jgi:aminoglycoside phosphotransferase (APT) family kinase protein